MSNYLSIYLIKMFEYVWFSFFIPPTVSLSRYPSLLSLLLCVNSWIYLLLQNLVYEQTLWKSKNLPLDTATVDMDSASGPGQMNTLAAKAQLSST